LKCIFPLISFNHPTEKLTQTGPREIPKTYASSGVHNKTLEPSKTDENETEGRDDKVGLSAGIDKDPLNAVDIALAQTAEKEADVESSDSCKNVEDVIES